MRHRAVLDCELRREDRVRLPGGVPREALVERRGGFLEAESEPHDGAEVHELGRVRFVKSTG